jgi:hypothetical protein
MASHFKWYPSDSEVVVPFNARYSFPSQANKAVKMTPRIPPKSGGVFNPGEVIRLEFPAQGYVNPTNTTLEFDVEMSDWGTPNGAITRFQNNIQSIFSRVRLLYGATPIEDIINYNVIVRALTEWTGTTQIGTLDQTSIADGIGGVVYGAEGFGGGNPPRQGYVNIRQAYIQGIDNSTNTQAEGGDVFAVSAPIPVNDVLRVVQGGNGVGVTPNNRNNTRKPIRRYQVNLALGLFTQEKLIPTKFMASQLAIEITLETAAGCMISFKSDSGTSGTPPTYLVKNVNLIPEILEFDASYDAMFLKGLQDGGVPLKFASWHTYRFGTQGSANLNLQVQERSRSVKALFAVQRRDPPSMDFDSGALFFCSNPQGSPGDAQTLQSYQFRIGGRYFPAAPVQTSIEPGSEYSNGGAEAFVELQKALNIVGDYRLSTGVNAFRWAMSPFGSSRSVGSNLSHYSEFDYALNVTNYDQQGRPYTEHVTNPELNAGVCFSGNMGSQCFAMAIDLETSNGVEISGLNAEEQSDISLVANYKGPQNTSFVIEVYSYFDAMIILRENNVLELIQ